MEITESRVVSIQNKIIKLSDVRKLAQIIVEEASKFQLDEKEHRIKFSATCFDGSIFSSKDVALFSDDSVLNSKRIESINLILSCYYADEVIDIGLKHNNSPYNYSKINIKGNNSNWVNGVLKRLEDLVESFQPQNNFLSTYQLHLKTITAISIGLIYIFLISLIPAEPSKNPEEWVKHLNNFIHQQPLFGYFMKYFFALLMGWAPASYIIDKLKALWPIVEIQIGPEHTYIEVKRRKLIAVTFIVGIVPLITSFIYDIIK